MSPTSGPPQATGNIDLGAVFQTFTNRTDQKRTHGQIFRSFLHELRKRDEILLFPPRSAGQTTAIAQHLVDLGCGDGTAAVEMVQAFSDVILVYASSTHGARSRVKHDNAKLIYHGFDNDDRFLQSTLEALNDLRYMYKDNPAVVDVKVDVRHVDVTGGDQLPLPRPMDHTFVSVGHLLYYAQSSSCIAKVVDNVVQLLGRRSMAMFVHSAGQCNLALLRESVASSVVVARPSVCIAEIAKQQQWKLISAIIPYWIQFPSMTSQQWEDCKDPRRYKLPTNRDDEKFTILLELLMFIAQRSLNDLAEEGLLETFVDAVRKHLNNENNRFVGLTDYQFILAPSHFSSTEMGTINDAVAAAVRSARECM